MTIHTHTFPASIDSKHTYTNANTGRDVSTVEKPLFFTLLGNLPDDMMLQVFQYLEIEDALRVIDSCYTSLLYNIHTQIKQDHTKEIKKKDFTQLLNSLQIIDIFTIETFWNGRILLKKEFDILKMLEKNIKEILVKLHSTLNNLNPSLGFQQDKTYSSLLLYMDKFIGLKHLFPVQNLNFHYIDLLPDEWISTIQELPRSLKNLNLSNSNISAESLKALSQLNRLENLNLFMIKLNSHEWEDVINALPSSITHLNLSNSNLSSAGIYALKHFTQLEYLNLFMIRLYPHECKNVINSLATTLKELNLGCSSISTEGLQALAHFNRLEKLNLFMIKLQPQEWEIAINALPPSLTHLNLSYSNISVSGLHALDHLNQLKNLNLFMIRLYPHEWERLANALPQTFKGID